MTLRPPRTFNGDSLQVWPCGGQILTFNLPAGFWVEFVPEAGVDAYLVQTPAVGRVVRTSSKSFPSLADGDAMDASTLYQALDVYPGQDVLGLDCDNARYFFGLVDDGAATDVPLLFEAAI